MVLYNVEFFLDFSTNVDVTYNFSPKRLWWITTARSVISQKSSGLIYLAAESWNQASLLVDKKNTEHKRNTERHSSWQKNFSWAGRNNLILLGCDVVIWWRNYTVSIFMDNNLKPETGLLEPYDARIRIFRNVGSYLAVDAVWNPWRPQPSTTLVWEPQKSRMLNGVGCQTFENWTGWFSLQTLPSGFLDNKI